MNRKILISIILGVLLVLGGLWYFGVFKTTDGNALGGGTLGAYEGAAATITRTNDGYEPRDVEVRVGGAVSFVNASDEYHWPASDVHPTHSIYSEFDPDAPIAPGETWTFVFTKPGEWKYHDHVRANLRGTIVVTE